MPAWQGHGQVKMQGPPECTELEVGCQEFSRNFKKEAVGWSRAGTVSFQLPRPQRGRGRGRTDGPPLAMGVLRGAVPWPCFLHNQRKKPKGFAWAVCLVLTRCIRLSSCPFTDEDAEAGGAEVTGPKPCGK